MSSEAKLNIDRWDESKDGTITEQNMKRKLKSKGYNSIVYHFPPGTTFPDHTHSYSKKDGVVSGRFQFSMYGQTVELPPGDLMDVPANTVHNAAVLGTETVVFLDASKTY